MFDYNGPACGSSVIPLPYGAGNAYLHGLACPAGAGSSQLVNMTIAVPDYCPPGDFEVKMDATATDGSKAFCVDVKLSLY